MIKKLLTGSYGFFTLLLAALFFTGCSNQTIPVKGTYTSQYAGTIANKSRETIWNNILDFCAQQGLSVKVIDKTSGLLIVDKLGPSWTFENDTSGTLLHPMAWLVLQERYILGHKVIPGTLNAEWNIRLRDLPEDKTLITINLIYVKDTNVYSVKYDTYVNENVLQAFSTGVLEKSLFFTIK